MLRCAASVLGGFQPAAETSGGAAAAWAGKAGLSAGVAATPATKNNPLEPQGTGSGQMGGPGLLWAQGCCPARERSAGGALQQSPQPSGPP